MYGHGLESIRGYMWRKELNPFEMLEELLWQDQFELVFSEQEDQNSPKIRLVYLMNDAVESFLLFVNARMTGQYRSDYNGELEAEFIREADSYVLIVRQGDHVVTIFFDDLQVEINLYRYGDLGHFWVEGYEYLRQLEYRLAILHTKCEYLGVAAASEEEQRLAQLVHFPPLNYACYPAVPEKYIVPMEDVWVPTEQAIAVMESIAEEAKDVSFLRWLNMYRRFPFRIMSKWIARLLHQSRHGAVTDLLMKKMEQESSRYPVRRYTFDDALEKRYQDILFKAQMRKAELEHQGEKVSLVREEPFTMARDSLEYHVYLMIWKEKAGNKVVEIESFGD